jgi:hypothetical protein
VKKLTLKQEAFANLIADGVGPKEAYVRAYGRGAMSDNALRVQASKTQNLEHVAARIAELRAKLDDERTMKRVEKRLILAKIARQPNRKASERIEAIKVDNVMAGHNEPERVEVFGMASLLDLVRKESPKP